MVSRNSISSSSDEIDVFQEPSWNVKNKFKLCMVFSYLFPSFLESVTISA